MQPQRGPGPGGVGAWQEPLLGVAAWGPGPVLRPEGLAPSIQETGQQMPLHACLGFFAGGKETSAAGISHREDAFSNESRFWVCFLPVTSVLVPSRCWSECKQAGLYCEATANAGVKVQT